MSIVLFRVDERLIHGQVVIGWGAQLKPQRIIVVDDALAGSGWEQELYTFGLPEEIEARFVTIADARGQLEAWRTAASRTFILTRDITTMQKLAAGGKLRGEEVNLGGIHHADGRQPVLPYLYLSAAETRALQELSGDGAVVSARDLPGSRRVGMDDLMRKSKFR